MDTGMAAVLVATVTQVQLVDSEADMAVLVDSEAALAAADMAVVVDSEADLAPADMATVILASAAAVMAADADLPSLWSCLSS